MDIVISKVFSLIILAISTTVAGLLPLKFQKRSSTPVKHSESKMTGGHKHGINDRLMNTVMAFSGGVLFSTIFIHLMPDVDSEFEKALARVKTGLLALNQEEPPSPSAELPAILTVKMPWGQLAICIGFFIIYALEEIVEYFICHSCEKQHHHHNDSTSDGPHSHHHRSYQNDETTTSLDQTTGSPLSKYNAEQHSSTSCLSPVHGTHGAHREPHQIRDCTEIRRLNPNHDISIDEVDLDEKTPLFKLPESVNVYRTNIDYHKDEPACSRLKTGDATCQIFVHNATPNQDDHHHNDHKHDEGDEQNGSIVISSEPSKFEEIRNTMRGLMLIVALSFHSVFEGMAIGLQFTTSGIWTSFAAVALHKLIMAFCAGMELLTLSTKRCIYIWSMITFAIICPIGIAIGTIVSAAAGSGQTSETNPSLLIASLQGLACGTLIYVTFFEVLTRTKGNEIASLINFVAVLCGFALITGLHLID